MRIKACRDCIHRERWECGSKVISYCNKLKSGRTNNGMKKVSCTDIITKKILNYD